MKTKHACISIAIIILVMCFYDFSLHAVDVFGYNSYHPFYPRFPLFGFLDYQIFWSVYWGLATALTLIMAILLIKLSNKKWGVRTDI